LQQEHIASFALKAEALFQMKESHSKINTKWLFTMAWRDSRRNRSRLLLFLSSIILGIAALVSTFSLGYNLQHDINDQARDLVGADLVIDYTRQPDPKMQHLLDSLGNQRSQERTFASMIYFIKNKGTRLVQVKALEGSYPYYGSLETTPVNAGRAFGAGRRALVDKTLMLQYGASIGDSIKIGDINFVISGILKKSPGRNEMSTTAAPPVYIPLRYLAQTGLMQKGSRIDYRYYYKYDSATDIQKLVSAIEPRLEQAGMDYETVESRKKNTSRAFDDFTQFLTLISFVSLLLGCIGVASAIHIYIREKMSSIAILRCLGFKSSQTFSIYLIQVAGIGLIGSLLGAVLGTMIQQVLPAVLKNLLPFQPTTTISFLAITQGIILGLIITLLFALLPLISVRNISPLNSLRMSVEPARGMRDPLQWLLYSLILFFIAAFSRWQMHSWRKAAVFSGSILIAFLFLVLVAKILMWLARRIIPSSWNYLWRQGFANLYRPNNQTIVLIITIGLGAAFIGTLYSVQSMLIKRVSISSSAEQPNMLLFDIQPGNKEAIESMTRQYGLPVLRQIPIVTMRIENINGIDASKALKDSTDSIPRRAFETEQRVTYRDSILETEKITAGEFESVINRPGDTAHISIEDRYASRLHLKIGDRIIFNVQGVLVPTVVGSFRQVDYRRLQPNFRIVFPRGILETAPQFFVMLTHVPSSEASAHFQQAVVRSYPNVSIIDLELILNVLNDLLDKIGFVIRFMAAFSICTGLVVLIASVLISKYQRIQESVLLRTLGASRKQILIITSLEFFFLGALGAGTGIILSLAGTWGLAKYSFESTFSPEWLPLITLFLAISLITIVIGIFNSREILNKPPLEILRKEV
jgi:putative ABC transport system permease protein